jgi:hypothetical protein
VDVLCDSLDVGDDSCQFAQLLVASPKPSVGVVIVLVAVEIWRYPPPRGVGRLRFVAELVVTWFALPFIGFYLGALPALSAQTRLMLGLPLGFRLTPKRFVDSTPAAARSG